MVTREVGRDLRIRILDANYRVTLRDGVAGVERMHARIFPALFIRET